MIEKYSPKDISTAIRELIEKQGSVEKFYDPTPEQAEIISITSNPLQPAVVIAGAGSGKTETMAARVIYLVANGFVKPHEILGLTFTRKAAGELSMRVRKRLRQLRDAGLISHEISLETSIYTYHSYAAKLLSEHSIRFGLDAESQPMGDAATWQLAHEIVTNWQDPTFTNQSPASTVIDDLLSLTKMVLEHQIDLAHLEDFDRAALNELLAFGEPGNEETREMHRTLTQRIGLLPMVRTFIQHRHQSGRLSFDDQMALAADMAQNFPDIAEGEKSKYKVVLLDEYQDTSQSQVRMLSSLYGGGHPVMAVGDPCQAIYSWRGASAGTISAFNQHFPKIKGQNGKEIFPLLTTFRNDKSILELANEVSEVIRSLGGIHVDRLTPRTGAEEGTIVAGLYENIETEAQAIADYLLPLWKKKDEDKAPESFAVLVRKKSQISAIESALRSAGIPVEVLGIGGLVHTPEVADIVTLLRIIIDPDSGASLMRHLTGPRLHIGPRDIYQLGEFSRSRAQADRKQSKTLIAQIIAGNPDQAEADDQVVGSLIESLDEIEKAEKSKFSPAGFERLKNFAGDLRRLRGRASAPLTDLISDIESYLNLEEEVLLRDGTGTGRRNLDRFMDEAATFSRNGGNLREFLDWLDIASNEEGGLKSGAPDVSKEVIQILTVHMSKGAEWDVVVVPGLVKGNFPNTYRPRSTSWLQNEGLVPFQLRGDRSELPYFSFAGATKMSEAAKAIKNFKNICNNYADREEIRLAYVAFTRAKSHLFLTASWFRNGLESSEPSELFDKALSYAQVQGNLLQKAEKPDKDAKNPAIENPEEKQWPIDPLGHRRKEFDQAVALVTNAQPIDIDLTLTKESNGEIASWLEDSQALIFQREIAQSGITQIPMPPRLSTSALVGIHRDRVAFAESIRRPLPRAQDKYSRRGTAFHLWVERYFGQATLVDDESLEYRDHLEGDLSLDQLIEKWMSSPWASRTDVKTELPFETVVAGVLVRGRIDAIFGVEGSGAPIAEKIEIIDWKTGSTTLDRSAQVQLAQYRIAYSQLFEVPLERISAGFHYVPTGEIDRPADLMDEREIQSLLTQFPLI